MPRLTIDLKKIEENTRLVAGMLSPFNVRLVGVTKACLGNWHVAAAMVAGGAAALADSRAASIARLRRHLPSVELQLLRVQPGEEPAPVPADLFFISSAAQARTATAPGGGARRFILLVETGDGREGVLPEQAEAEISRLGALPGAVAAGLATNTACARGVLAPGEPLERFRKTAGLTAPPAVAGAPRPVISAGGSGLLGLLQGGRQAGWLEEVFGWLTDLRSGEALLLGNIPAGGGGVAPLPGAHRDAFVLEAPALEVSDKGGRRQVLAGLGIQDIGAGKVTPVTPGLAAGTVTSDYLALDGSELMGALPAVGEILGFIPSYYALLAAMTSPFVEKVLVGAGQAASVALGSQRLG
ncbi:MAG: hypothetical protein C4534_07260 [Gaiellales bacterium]|nr:MAG: hypothetical protein C4534_07260 [Gaiellales bacterium]